MKLFKWEHDGMVDMETLTLESYGGYWVKEKDIEVAKQQKIYVITHEVPFVGSVLHAVKSNKDVAEKFCHDRNTKGCYGKYLCMEMVVENV